MNIIAVAVADYTGIVLLLAMLSNSRFRRSQGQFEIRLFTNIAILTLIACVVDFFSFYTDGKPGLLNRIVCMLANTYCFMANPIFISSWCLYEDYKLYKSKKRVKRIYSLALIPAIILVFVAVINVFYPVIFYIDESNVYHRLPLSYFYYVVDLIYLFFSWMVLRKYEIRYGKTKFFSLSMMVGPIVLGCAIQAAFYGVSLIWVSLSIGLTSIYMSIQNEFSYLDILTGLYNRAYLDYQIDSMLRERNPRLGAIMIDVDYFKKINDTYGHSVGDEALIDVARVITFSKPDKAIATRFAGDEFILLVNNTNKVEMENIISNIREELRIFNDTEGRQYNLSLSLGYSIYDVDKGDRDSFFRHMDENMYLEKKIKHKK